MNATKITTPDFIDILFDGRNKNYGAYEHRVTYEKRVRNAVFGTATLALVVIGGYLISSNLRAAEVVKPVTVREIPPMTEVEILEEKFIPPPPVKAAEPPKVATQQYTQFVVTDRPVDPSEEPPKMEDLDKKAIGVKSQDGDAGENDPGLEGVLGGTHTDIVGPPPVKEEDNSVHNFVEIMPSFPGGDEALQRFLKKNINYPHIAAENGIQGTVFVSFVIGKDGEISDVKLVGAKKGGGLEEEAARVVNKMPKWKAGRQNGRAVNVQFSLPISFKLENNY
ncbi:TonB family protein [Chitinophaga horti]|uniref:TonB family protein n=1 Tax=Chitinophaga horti TaxID=2920382 RepID=A0ABY6IX14_9BACT|nr:energy transducer TonB [Chitinophaga horti]UYQ91911.1 TonB family protein [Chitinophaga horti]